MSVKTMGEQSIPFVSVVLVARNANRHVEKCLYDLLNQDYPAHRMEFILVDGMSTDGTKESFYRFQSDHQEREIHILDNPGKILACGWNVALEHAKGDVIVRFDAHSRVPPEYLRKCVFHIMRGESIVGGRRISVCNSQTLMARALQVAETSGFGAGVAVYRRGRKPCYVDTLAHAAYHRRVFSAVGGYDERLVRTEDNDIHYRMKKRGFKFFFDPEIVSYHYIRNSLLGMLTQKFLNGYWIGITLSVTPTCFSVRYFIPTVFVYTLLIATAIGFAVSFTPLLGFLIFYFIVGCISSLPSFHRSDKQSRLAIVVFLIPILFAVHFAYGLGTVWGICAIPFYLWKWRSRKDWIPQNTEARLAREG